MCVCVHVCVREREGDVGASCPSIHFTRPLDHDQFKIHSLNWGPLPSFVSLIRGMGYFIPDLCLPHSRDEVPQIFFQLSNLDSWRAWEQGYQTTPYYTCLLLQYNNPTLEKTGG